MPNGYNKNWVRLCAAIEGFRVRYDRWPQRVRLFTGALANLRERFTEEEYSKLTSTVALIADEQPFVAEDDQGGQYSFGADGFPQQHATPRAANWLGVRPAPE